MVVHDDVVPAERVGDEQMRARLDSGAGQRERPGHRRREPGEACPDAAAVRAAVRLAAPRMPRMRPVSGSIETTTPAIVGSPLALFDW